MTTLVTKGVFDVLHSNHKIFLSTLIEKSNCDSILILLSSDERAAFFKGKERPLFTYEWRQLDLYKFISKQFPNIRLRFKAIKVSETDKQSLGFYINNSQYIIGLKGQYNWLKYQYRDLNNLILLDEQPGHHTSEISNLITNGEEMSGCTATKSAAVRVREGIIQEVGRNGIQLSSVTKIGQPMSCYQCSPGRCNYYNEVEIALANSIPGDDLFLSCTPDLSRAKQIVNRKVNRVVYFKDSDNREGLDYLKTNKVKIKKAGVYYN